ncbi:DEKNAAC104398 [Brettanomyces naardenensis]|uniref:DEKNAAC104398 n=1 Tax=Brettanomyces naardenensis TaxID=13370 RepID=A0A448YQT4_BRENA|nr:DEKNAAC104398 [Brettanomyces naardenensis]
MSDYTFGGAASQGKNRNNKHHQSSSSDAAAISASVGAPTPMDDTPTALLEQLVYVDNFLQSSNDPISDSPNFEEQLSAELAAFADDEFIFPDEDKPKKRGTSDDNTPGSRHDTPSVATANDQGSWQFHDVAAATTSSSSGATNFSEVTNSFQGASFASPGAPSAAPGIPATIQELLTNQGLSSQPSVPQLLQSSPQPLAATQSLLGTLGASDASIAQVQRLLPRVQIPQGAQNTLAAAGLSQTQIEALATLIACYQGDVKQQLLQQQQEVSSQAPSVASTGTAAAAPAPEPFESSSFSGFQNVDSPLSTHHSDLLAQSILTPHPYNSEDSVANRINNHTSNSSPAGSIPPGIASNFSATAQTFPLAGSATSSSTGSSSRSPVQSTGGSSNITMSGQKLSMSSASTSPMSSDSKADVEKDKRRRNTAASARFRIKKKLKEQEMERSLKELSDISKNLEMKVQQLQMENKLLRNLVIEKNHQRDADEVARLKKKAKLSVAMERGEGEKGSKLSS